MAIAYISGIGAASGDTSSATTSTVDTTGADLIIVVTNTFNSHPAPTDAYSNTWTSAGTATGSAYGGTYIIEIWYCASPTVGSAHTFSISPGATTYPGIAAAAFSGSKASPFDQIGAGAFADGTPFSLGSVTPSENNCLVIGGMHIEGIDNPPVASIDSGFTISVNQAGAVGTGYGSLLAYKIQTTAAAVNPSATLTSSQIHNVGLTASFKAASVAGGGGPLMRGQLIHGGSLIGGRLLG